MRQLADVTLIENSIAGNPPKTFAGQTIEVRHTADTVVQGLDGAKSFGHHPSRVFWTGGTAAQLSNVTDIRIVGSDGLVLLDAEINRTFEVPIDVDGGVTFAALKRE